MAHTRALSDEDRFLFWERVESLAAPIHWHPTDPADRPAKFAGRPELNGSTWAWTTEVTHVLRLVFAARSSASWCQTHPSHGRDDSLRSLAARQSLPAGCGHSAPDELPSAIIKRHIWITTTGVCDPVAMTAAMANLGEDRVMFSVDYPYESSKVAGEF